MRSLDAYCARIDSRNEHHTVAILASQQTPLIDNAQAFWVASFGEQIVLLEGRHTRQEYPAVQKSGQVWVRTSA